MESSITETLMMEQSFDRCEDGVVGFGLVDDSVVSGDKKGIVMESDERISRVDDWGSGMCLNGEVSGSGVADGGNFGENLVESVGKAREINLVVDLRHCSTKESDCKMMKSDVKKVTNDVEFTEKEGEYEFADLVWGKVKNHQWWPGQIINPSSSTYEAMKHFKKDGFLIAYFGDQKLACNESSSIKPFRINFCKMEGQSDGEAFIHAVNHAVHEAARRIEFGLTCSCVSEEVYDKIKSQIVVNSGIRKESSRIDGADRFSTVNSFNPDKTVDFLLDLAKDPFGINRLDVSTIGSQLSAFNRWKGYHQLQLNEVFPVSNFAPHSKGKMNARGRPSKHKRVFDSGLSPSKKVKSLSELMSNGNESASDVEYKPKKRGRKRKVIEPNASGEGCQSQSQSQTADEFLSQVYMAARNPTECQHNLGSLVKFSSDFKNYRLRKDKNDEEITNQPSEENSATALTFKFTNLDSVPSLKKLHAIFRRYGALQETETRVFKKKKCVKLVFERKCDAETAFSSTGKFSIFGPALLSYRLNFSPTLRKTGTASMKG